MFKMTVAVHLIQAQQSPLLSYLSFFYCTGIFVQCTLHLMSFFFLYLWYHRTINEQALRFPVVIHNNAGDGIQWWRRALSFGSLIYM